MALAFEPGRVFGRQDLLDAVGSADKTLKVWDAASGKQTLVIAGHAADAYLGAERSRGDLTARRAQSMRARDFLVAGDAAGARAAAFKPNTVRSAHIEMSHIVSSS